MAIKLHWEILDKYRIELLKQLVNIIDLDDCYMAGGTALSLQLGLRKSVDFDFFVPGRLNSSVLFEQLRSLDRNIIATDISSRGTCDVIINGVQVSFMEYHYKLVDPLIESEEIAGLKLASINDIASMKALAMANRGSKKDFFDLYHIYKIPGFDTEKLVSCLRDKYGENTDLSYIGMGLNYFDDAEDEVLPETFVKYDWDKIKLFFSNIQNDFMKELGVR